MGDTQKILLEAARESLGIYPQAIKRGDEWEYRTPWQDGWNAAILALLTNYQSIRAWLAELSPEAVGAVHELLAVDVLCLIVRHDVVECLIPMNDVFEYAVAEAEIVTPGDLPVLTSIWQKWGWSGLIAWVAIRRNEAPIRERQDDQYHTARIELEGGTSC